jgi:D-alanyl-D-alanine carboxypeptidase/D-alanyl-D-alanine-endopeptidase (penicillin-binding protein 4)
MRLLPLLLLCVCAMARAQGLPPPVEAALARARLPADAVTVLVTDVESGTPARVAHRTQVPINPASIAKLATTFAALELLGPAYTWSTPVLVDGPIEAGTLRGNLYLRGQGDPKLVLERLWLLLRRVRALGVERIAGDIVLDRSAFQLPPVDPAAFDNEPLRPYNAAPDALLVNFKSVVLTLTPRTDGQARVVVEPPLAGVQWPAVVPLATGPCADWRAALQLDLRDPLRPRLPGSYAQSCGERVWPLAFPDATFAARAIGAMWNEVGGTLAGAVRDGAAPASGIVLATSVSPTLAEVVRDINKFSNNVMARQLFLTLALQQDGVARQERARELLQAWWRRRFAEEPPWFDNGSGLSRDERATARQIGRLLQAAWASPLMPEFIASLPTAGIDGTMRRSRAAATAHLKTGSLRDVQGVAGYVDGQSGRRYVVVAIANHPNASAVHPVIEALLGWVAQDR